MSGADLARGAGDAAAAAVSVATVAQWLPAVAALFTIIWTGIRIGEWVVAKCRGKRPPDDDPDK